MVRQLVSMLLAATVLFAGVIACPRGVLSCTMMKQTNHACCGDQLSLRSRDCCSGRTQLPAPALGSMCPHNDPAQTHGACAVTNQLGAGVQPTVGNRHHHHGSPAPPDTPITLHTALLL